MPIEDAELWMRYRNAMDRLLLVQRGINFGEFPSPNSLNEDIEAENIEEVGLTDSSNPDDILRYAEYLFRNCGVEAWVQAAETLICFQPHINIRAFINKKTPQLKLAISPDYSRLNRRRPHL